MENERRYRRRNSDVKEENMESSEQEPRTVRHEYGSSSAGDSIGQARRVIDELEARINDARRVPMSKTLSIIDTGELIDLIGQLRIVLPHTVVQAQAILDERKKILGEAKEEAKASTGKADAYYTEKVENAKRFEQDVKMEADAYDKQIRQKAQEDSNARIFIGTYPLSLYSFQATWGSGFALGSRGIRTYRANFSGENRLR